MALTKKGDLDIFELFNSAGSYLLAKDFLRSRQIIRSEVPSCSKCGRVMSQIKHGRGEQLIWRCRNHNSVKMSLRHESFLDKCKLQFTDFIFLVYFWSREISVTACTTMMKVSKRSIIEWFSNFRQICSTELAKNPAEFGGPGVIVQVDESVMCKRKFNRGGPLTEEKWVFGIYDTAAKLGYLAFVDERSADSVIATVLDNIQPGSTLHSYCWKSFHRLSQTQFPAEYIQQTKNPKKEEDTTTVDDPLPGPHTNHVHSMWKTAQKKFKSMSGVHSSMLPSYLDEFMWRQRFGKTHVEAFENILRHISQQYPVPS